MMHSMVMGDDDTIDGNKVAMIHISGNLVHDVIIYGGSGRMI